MPTFRIGSTTIMSKSTGKRSILVVEDEALIAMLLCDMLAELDCRVVGPLGRLEQAIEATRREEFDAAILDVNLNGEVVYPVAETLRDRGIPFAFATGYDGGDLRTPWNDWPYLVQKPFEWLDLARGLDRLLARS